MIDYDAISDEFIRIARLGVGSRLSQIGPTGGKFGTVILVRQDGPKPSYPYITLDRNLNTSNTKGWLLDEGVTVDEEGYWETDKTVLMQFTVYGDEADSIANELEGYFRLDRIRDDIRSATGGALVQTFEVVPVPEILATEHVEAAFFNLTFSIVDRVVDTQTGVFDTINLDGELFRSQDDIEPLPIDITATSVAP